MSKTQVLIASLLATAGIGFAGAASAQTSSNSNSSPSAYVGGNIGVYNKYDIRCDTGVACDRKASRSGKLYGGYDFGGFGVEALVYSTGKATGSVTQGGLSVPGKLSQSGVGVVGVLPYSLGDVTLKGKLGLAYARGKAEYTAGGVSDKSTLTPLVGASVGYALTKTVSLNADWDQTRAKYNSDNRSRVNMFSLGVSTKF